MSLELVSTDDLITELLTRADHGFVAIYRCLTEHPDGTGKQECIRRWKGNSHMVAGLCLDCSDVALAEYWDKVRKGG